LGRLDRVDRMVDQLRIGDAIEISPRRQPLLPRFRHGLLNIGLRCLFPFPRQRGLIEHKMVPHLVDEFCPPMGHGHPPLGATRLTNIIATPMEEYAAVTSPFFLREPW